MSWNYRVVRRKYQLLGEDCVDYAIHEAYYGRGGDARPTITENPVDAYGESVEEVRWCLERMLEALDKPVLDYETREEIDAPTPRPALPAKGGRT